MQDLRYGLRLLRRSRGESVRLDARAIAFAVGLTAAVALVVGVVPARRATRADPLVALRAQ